MASELIYTSAPRGVRPGASGFCTVAYTRGMPSTTIRLLESLSAYKHLYAAHDSRAASNPVAFNHYRYTISGRGCHVVSRISITAADHTNRSNTIAHHLLISPEERPVGGPAWLALRQGVFVDSWNDEPRRFEASKSLPKGDYESLVAGTWREVTGDAGWAGHLAYSYQRRPREPVFLLFEPGQPMLELVAEALALLPVRKRWEVSFSTYFTLLPAGATCAWRCCVPGSEAAREIRRFPRALVIDLTKPLAAPPDNPLLKTAREGTPQTPRRRTGVRRTAPSTATAETRRLRVLAPGRSHTVRINPRKPGEQKP